MGTRSPFRDDPGQSYERSDAGSLVVATCLLTAVEPLLRFLPVHDVPPRTEIIRAAILILQIIGVLPHVDADHRELPFHHRRVLVGTRTDLHAAAGFDEP